MPGLRTWVFPAGTRMLTGLILWDPNAGGDFPYQTRTGLPECPSWDGSSGILQPAAGFNA